MTKAHGLLQFIDEELDKAMQEPTFSGSSLAGKVALAIRSRCDCKYAILSRRTCADGRFQFFTFCPNCGVKSSAIAKAKLSVEAMETATDERDLPPPVTDYQSLRAVVAARAKERGVGVDYQEYLESGSWQTLRWRVFQLDGGECQMCKKKTSLEGHHLHYRNLGHESDADIVCLCRECHGKVTEDIRYARDVLAPSFAVVKTAGHYKNARRKHDHYESLKRHLQAFGLKPDDYERRIQELARAMEL